MNWLGAPGSVQAAVLAEFGWVLIAGTAAVFVLTMTLLALALCRRNRPAVPTAWWTVGAGIVLPTIVLAALLAYAVLRTAGLDRPPATRPLVVSVTGHLWWWALRYHDPATGRWIDAANELHLPAGRPVQLGLQSADVIHSFWVPTLGGKMDLVPGRVNRLVITPRAPGVHRGVCAEYCGTQHARMALHVVVEPPEAFDRWLAGQARPASAAHAAAGRSAFVEHGCAGCHAVRGVAEDGVLGPDLTHVGSRLHIGSGTVRNEPRALARWIADAHDLKPGVRMPAFAHLEPATLDALAAWLTELR